MHKDLQAHIILLIIGAISGWLAGQIVKGYGFGLVGNIVVGGIGACIGGWLFPGFLPLEGILSAIVSATLGAIILLVVIGLVRRVA